MASKLPPLGSLRVFSAAAKYESFAKAASELGLTSGAVSKQIALLEDYLGWDLFKRSHRNVALTKTAKDYLKSVNSALITLEKATTKHRKRDNRKVLNINILPSLSNQWLLPKLENFKTLYPNYQINIKVGNGAIDFEETNTDIATRIGRKGDFPNLCKEKLIEEKLLCVCSPKLLKKYPIKNARDLANSGLLLQHTTRPTTWEDYLKAHGIKKLNLKYDIGFERFFMLTQAAKDGLGFALIPDFLIQEELENNSLVIATTSDFKSEYFYYLIHPKQKSHLPKIINFKDWIKAQCLN